ncbi:MAG: hypothetical protein QNL01_08685 [Akkermansiaceae bacterium]
MTIQMSLDDGKTGQRNITSCSTPKVVPIRLSSKSMIKPSVFSMNHQPLT